MWFRLYPLRFSFEARDSIYFPPHKSANILRGAFGLILRKIACQPQCPGASECEWRTSCPYASICEPLPPERSPSGLADWPRPFVFRATHLDGRTIAPGETFQFDMHLFDMRNPAISYLTTAFSHLVREGLGPGRGRAELLDVSQLDERGPPKTLGGEPTPITLDLSPEAGEIARVHVRFVTPTELKSGQQLVEQPDFGVLASRIRDRLSTLRERYDAGPLEIDFRGFGERASRVRMTRCELQRVEVERRSSKTGQTHAIGGFVGEAEYEGDLAEFIPYLRAAKWTGVGRQTVWGKGEIETRILKPESRESRAPE